MKLDLTYDEPRTITVHFSTYKSIGCAADDLLIVRLRHEQRVEDVAFVRAGVGEHPSTRIAVPYDKLQSKMESATYVPAPAV